MIDFPAAIFRAYNLKPGTWYLVTCHVEGDRTRIYLNGKLAVDTAPPFHGKRLFGKRRRVR